MLTDLLIIIFLLFFSASFSSFETALFSFSSLERERLKNAGGLSLLISKIIQKPRHLLTTVLLGNELVNVSIAIFSGSLAYRFFSPDEVSAKKVYLISTAITTLTLLIFGEIIPKNIAIRNPLILSQFLVLPYQLFEWLVTPFRFLFSKIGDAIIHLVGVDPSSKQRMIVEEEIRSLVEHGKKEGTLADLERSLIHNALDFAAVPLTSVMTGKEKIMSIPMDTSPEAVLSLLKRKRFSRIPVYEAHPDHIVGILHVKELMELRLKNSEKNSSLKNWIKPPFIISPEKSLEDLFQKFQKHRVHMAIVKDKTQKVLGLVTMDDLMRRFLNL